MKTAACTFIAFAIWFSLTTLAHAQRILGNGDVLQIEPNGAVLRIQALPANPQLILIDDVNGGAKLIGLTDDTPMSVLRRIADSYADRIRHSLTETLLSEIAAIESACSLNDHQRKKLQLAGHGDIARILRRIETIRHKYDDSSFDNARFGHAQAELHDVLTDANSQPFNERSLFRKTMQTTLSEEQYKFAVRSRQIVVVNRALELLKYSGKEFQLTEEQRSEVIELILAKTNPPMRVGKYGPYIVLYQAANLEEPLQRILDDQQWAVFQDRIAFARKAIPDLRARGLLPEFQPEEPEADRPKRN